MVGGENIGKEMHPAVKNYSAGVVELKTRGRWIKKYAFFGKINNSLAERASLLLLSEVCVVNINTHIFYIPSNFIILALPESKYVIILNNGLSAAWGEMVQW